MITPADLIAINAALHGGTAQVRDPGLVASAAARPQAVTFGAEAFPTVEEKAAALLHSVLGNHPFVDGNKRVGWTAARVLLALHGKRPGLSEDEAFDLVVQVAAAGSRTDVQEVAKALRVGPRPTTC
ncbi:type II toxin-antitoxin system death-on-curing family toxin [Actinomadura spongiicola]|uniref:Type II toxin-antitoxin system death-on-curing family toxin n=1 Tax=Actinomadura spongiicola TaxID=2303421 RepID=A0A372G8X7_9ACTN|nr:type II toxin-antitoxin system death-on-curing family toxin [Actinomadura spongiicola]RFS81854.1 type II toxin-antitoxin system death-on-curing family toxin [Actinomadura spongiicola]